MWILERREKYLEDLIPIFVNDIRNIATKMLGKADELMEKINKRPDDWKIVYELKNKFLLPLVRTVDGTLDDETIKKCYRIWFDCFFNIHTFLIGYVEESDTRVKDTILRFIGQNCSLTNPAKNQQGALQRLLGSLRK